MGWFELGNVLREDPIAIYNHGHYTHYRDAMQAGHIAELEHCRNCSIILSRLAKDCLPVA